MNYINKYRKEKGYTLTKLADLVGVSTGYLCHLEKGRKKNPSYRVMKKITDILEKSITEIFEV